MRILPKIGSWALVLANLDVVFTAFPDFLEEFVVS